MFKRILVPLDCSDLAEQVLASVKALAKGLNARITLFTVIRELPREFADSAGIDQRALMESWRRQAEDYLAHLASQLEQENFAVDFAVGQGDVAEIVNQEAEQTEHTLIALSTHGWEGSARWNMGSVGHRLLQEATTPVLVVRGKAGPTTSAIASLDRIIVPLDGSGLSEQSLPYAIALAEANASRLSLLRVTPSVWDYYSHMDHTVVHSGDISKAGRDRANEYLQRMSERLRSDGVANAELHAEQGEPAGTIIDLAEATPNSLIVMVTHGEGSKGIRRRTMGSVAQRVAGGCLRPVLVIQPGSQG